MSKYDELISKVAKTARGLMNRSSKILEVTKLNITLGEIRSDIDAKFKSIGKKVYDAYEKGTDIPSDIDSICSEIKEKYERIDDIQNKISELKRKKVCPECGKESSIEDTFCAKCGYEYKE